MTQKDLDFDRKVEKACWFIDFCKEGIGLLLDWGSEEGLTLTEREVLRVYREQQKDMEDYLRGLRFNHYRGVKP